MKVAVRLTMETEVMTLQKPRLGESLEDFVHRVSAEEDWLGECRTTGVYTDSSFQLLDEESDA